MNNNPYFMEYFAKEKLAAFRAEAMRSQRLKQAGLRPTRMIQFANLGRFLNGMLGYVVKPVKAIGRIHTALGAQVVERGQSLSSREPFLGTKHSDC